MTRGFIGSSISIGTSGDVSARDGYCGQEFLLKLHLISLSSARQRLPFISHATFPVSSFFAWDLLSKRAIGCFSRIKNVVPNKASIRGSVRYSLSKRVEDTIY